MNTSMITRDWQHIFAYGSSGSGKTTLASWFPKPFLLVPRAEQSQLSLKGRNIDFMEITNSKEMLDAIGYFENIQNTKGSDALEHETLVIESLSHYTDQIVEEFSRNGAIKDARQVYGVVNSHFRTIQQRLRRLDMHVIFTALAATTQSADGETTTGEPLISGRTKTMLPASCDIIGYCEVREGRPPVYKFHTRAHKGFMARTRYNSMPAEFIIGGTKETSLWHQMRPYIFPAPAPKVEAEPEQILNGGSDVVGN